MASFNIFLKEYSNFEETFKETSIDDNDKNSEPIYLCNDTTQKVINFDKVIEARYKGKNNPKSFDSIFVDNENIYCIEFKNQLPRDIKNKDIKEKIIFGKQELIKCMQELNINIKEYNFIYVVVYKECKNDYEKHKCGIGSKEIKFELDKLIEDGFIKDVFTQDVTFFTRAFKLKYKKELMC